MSQANRYTLHHPRWYRRRVSVWWWLESWRYTRFALRELTCVPVALFAALTLWQVESLIEGPEAYQRFLARLESPFFLGLHTVSFVFVLFHALTWFHLAPKAAAVTIGGKRVSDSLIVGLNYLAWLALSGAVAWVWLGA